MASGAGAGEGYGAEAGGGAAAVAASAATGGNTGAAFAPAVRTSTVAPPDDDVPMVASGDVSDVDAAAAAKRVKEEEAAAAVPPHADAADADAAGSSKAESHDSASESVSSETVHLEGNDRKRWQTRLHLDPVWFCVWCNAYSPLSEETDGVPCTGCGREQPMWTCDCKGDCNGKQANPLRLSNCGRARPHKRPLTMNVHLPETLSAEARPWLLRVVALLEDVLPGCVVREFVVLQSEKGCAHQQYHADYLATKELRAAVDKVSAVLREPADAERLEGDNAARVPCGCVIALQDATTLNGFVGSHGLITADASSPAKRDAIKRHADACEEHVGIPIPAGAVGLFRGDFIHGGSAYDSGNLRIHAYVDFPDVKREPNATYIPRKVAAFRDDGFTPTRVAPVVPRLVTEMVARSVVAGTS